MKSKPKIVVIGGSGFIGTCLVAKLSDWGYEVRIIDERQPAKHQDFRAVDLTKSELDEGHFEGCDTCICLAARSSGIGYFNGHPAKMLDENLKILSTVFNA